MNEISTIAGSTSATEAGKDPALKAAEEQYLDAVAQQTSRPVVTKAFLEQRIQRAWESGSPRSAATSLAQDLVDFGLARSDQGFLTLMILEEGARKGLDGLRQTVQDFGFYASLPS